MPQDNFLRDTRLFCAAQAFLCRRYMLTVPSHRDRSSASCPPRADTARAMSMLLRRQPVRAAGRASIRDSSMASDQG